MLDIIKRKIVTTRKEHECFGCLKVIEKGESAVCITAKEDEQHTRFHLHLDCNKVIARKNIDLQQGCVKDGAATPVIPKIAHCDEIDRNQMVFTCGMMTSYSENYLEGLSDEKLIEVYDHVMSK